MESKSSGLKPFRIPDDPEIEEAIRYANNCDDNEMCLTCREYYRALFHVGGGQVVIGCPNCLLIALSRIRGGREELPPEVARLEKEALDELDVQNRKKLRILKVIPEEIYYCRVCGKELTQKEIRLFFKPGENESLIYCASCQEEIESQYPSRETKTGLKPVYLDKKAGVARMDET
jgi:hypothetical protein